jgi:hypothetical protein
MIVEGFFQQVLERMPGESVRDRVTEAVQQKLAA